MGVSMKDIKLVSVIVSYVMSLHKHKRDFRLKEKERKYLPHYFKKAFKNFSKTMRKPVRHFFDKDWVEGIESDKFEELNLILRNKMDKDCFPDLEFIQFCYQISELAACSLSKGFKPASKLAEHYLLEAIKCYRSKKQFSDYQWVVMESVAHQYISKK